MNCAPSVLMKQYTLFFFLCFLCQSNLFAFPFVSDTTAEKVKYAKYITADQLQQHEITESIPDTLLDDFRFWDPSNSETPTLNTGNYGSPYQMLIYQMPEFSVFGATDQNRAYKFTPAMTRYFNSHGRMTDITYFQGSKKLQSIWATHTQNLSPELSIGIDFRKSGSLGHYLRQKTNLTNFDLHEMYHTINKKYYALVSFTGNKIIQQENGGLENDLYLQIKDQKPSELPVNFSDAKHFHNERELYIGQFLNFGYFTSVVDTSDSTKSIKTLHPTSQLSYSFNYKKARSFFENNENSSDYFFDSLTYDSSGFYKIRNEIAFTTKANRSKKHDQTRSTRIQGSVFHENIFFQQRVLGFYGGDYRTTLDNIYVHAIADGMISRKYSWGVDGQFNVYGNPGDFKSRIYAYMPIDSNSYYVGISGGYMLCTPELILQKYLSNQFVWNNNFSKSSVAEISLGFYDYKHHLKFEVNYFSLANTVVYNQHAVPVQYASSISHAVLSLEKNFHLGKFRIENKVYYQPSDNSIIRTPDWVTTNSVLFESHTKNNTGTFCSGIEFRYYSSFYANGYRPESGVFYLQDSLQVGKYPIISALAMLKLKRARLFVKAENLYEVISGLDDFSVPHYPMANMRLILGISWRFFD